MQFSGTYKKAFFWALGLHVVIVSLLFIDIQSQPNTLVMSQASPKTKPKIINAVTVSAEDIQQQMQQISNQQQQKQLDKQRQAQRYKQQLAKLKQQKTQAAQKLKKMQQQAKRAELKRQTRARKEKRRIAALKKQQALEAIRLKSLKQKQAVLKKQAAAKALAAAKAKRLAASKAKALAAAKAKTLAANAARQAAQLAILDKYRALILQAISQNWIVPEGTNPALTCQLKVRLAPNGVVLSVSLNKSSGDPILDRSAESAVYKASPLPVPKDPDLFNQVRNINLTVRPQNIITG